jgi:Domain of unknown function (DUF5624)
VRFIRLFWLALLLLATSAAAQPTSYTAPEEFMDLFFDFTGSNEPDYPAGQPTLGQMLTQSVVARESGAPGPLVLVVGSKIYVYDSANGARLSEEQFRADRASGFFEMTAISHIGPALAYLAQIKAYGDARWRERLVSLRMHTAEVRALNQRAAGNWLDLLNEPAWSTHKTQIRAVRGGGGIERRPRFFLHQDVLRMCGDGCRVVNMLASCFFLKTGIIHHPQ